MMFRAIAMRCDHASCLQEVMRAPRIVVPSRTPAEVGHRPIRIMTVLHYCELHAVEGLRFCCDEYFTDARKKRVERLAAVKRPIGFRPDFDRARVELVLVTTPEYRAFLHDIGARDAA